MIFLFSLVDFLLAVDLKDELVGDPHQVIVAGVDGRGAPENHQVYLEQSSGLFLLRHLKRLVRKVRSAMYSVPECPGWGCWRSGRTSPLGQRPAQPPSGWSPATRPPSPGAKSYQLILSLLLSSANSCISLMLSSL